MNENMNMYLKQYCQILKEYGTKSVSYYEREEYNLQLHPAAEVLNLR